MFEKFRDRWTKAIKPLVLRLEGVDHSILTWSSLILSLGAFYLLMEAGADSKGSFAIIGGIVIIIIVFFSYPLLFDLLLNQNFPEVVVWHYIP